MTEQKIIQGLISRSDEPQRKAIKVLKKHLRKELIKVIIKRGNAEMRKNIGQALEDVFHEVLVRLFEHVYKGKTINVGKNQLKIWCLAVAKNALIDWGKWTVRERNTKTSLEMAQNISEKDQRWNLDRGEEMWKAWKKLGDKCKDLFWERYWNQKKLKEIAEERKQTDIVVRQAFYKCIRKMRKTILGQ